MMNKAPDEKKFLKLREKMVKTQIVARNIRNRAVIQNMREIPRHLFVPPEYLERSYDDSALPIKAQQTISQPYIVALMSETLAIEPHHKVLEVGTGSGYQTALLSRLADAVYSVEIIPALMNTAQKLLKQLKCANIHFKLADGTLGWKDACPFDRIIVTAAPITIPQYLIDQLKKGGRLILPLGYKTQKLVVIDREMDGKVVAYSGPSVRFVPMVGIAEQEN